MNSIILKVTVYVMKRFVILGLKNRIYFALFYPHFQLFLNELINRTSYET